MLITGFNNSYFTEEKPSKQKVKNCLVQEHSLVAELPLEPSFSGSRSNVLHDADTEYNAGCLKPI